MTFRDRISAGLAGLAIAVAVLGGGAATRWIQAVVALLVALALSTVVPSRRRFQRLGPLLWILIVATSWTALQLVPLPSGLIEILTPTLDSLRADGAEVAGAHIRSTLTMDPGGTLRALTFVLTLSGLAVVVLRLAVSERGRYWIVAFVAGLIGVSAVIALVHEFLGATRLYGLYQPVQATPPIMGPLLNANHFGCLTATGTVVSVGLFLHAKQSTRVRVLWVVNGVACLVVTLATLSRGAVIAMVSGLVLTVGVAIAQRLQQTKRSRQKRELLLARTLPVGIIIAACLVVAIYVSASGVVQQLEHTTLHELHEPKSKFAAWRSTIELVSEAPWTGVGRGAFETTFTRVHPASALVTFSHPENEALQVVVEWGVPVAIILAVLAGWLVVRATRRWRDGPLTAGALGAMLVVAIQSNFDFGMELLGLAAPLVAIVACVTYVPLSELPRSRPLGRLGLRVAHVAAILVGAGLLLTSMTIGVEDDHLALRNKPDRAAVIDVIERHPLDYYAFAILAEGLLRENDSAGVRFLNHALRLHPTHAGLHRLAARMLVRTGRLSQAESEYAATIRGTPELGSVIDEMITVLPPDRIATAIPLDLDVDRVVRILLAAKQSDIAIRWLDRLLAQHQHLHTIEVLYSVAMDANRLDAAESASRLRCDIVPSTKCRLELARVLARANKHADVILELQDVPIWRGHRDDQVEAYFLLCDAYAATSAPEKARQCLRRLEGSGVIQPGDQRIESRLSKLPPIAPGSSP